MDIFILSDGKEIGPFSEQTAQTLIKQGTVAAGDLAWASGMEDWAPLEKVLSLSTESAVPEQAREASEASSSGVAGDAPTEAKPEIEPATPKQKAFLGYLAIDIPEDLSREHASTLLNDAMEDPACAEKIGMWSAERLRLHPELFAAEIHARKENRANHFFEICQTEGAQYFTRITKAHCQVLVGFLDVKFPSWDSRMEDAATNYFFPAIAEKFPQLIERDWKDRFHYVQELGTESARKAPTTRIKKRPLTPLAAVLRGIALGGAVLAVLYLGQRMIPHWIGRHSADKAGSDIPSPPSPSGVAPAESPKAAESAAAASPAPKKDEDKTAAQGEAAPPPSTPPPAKDPQDAAASPEAAPPPPEKPPSDPSTPAPAAAPSSDSTPPPAAPAPPGTATPTPATPAPSTPPPTTDAPAPATPPSQESAIPSKSDLVLTKPVELQLAYGKVKLTVGIAVKLVSRDGALLKVNYQNTIIVVPASSTDIDSAAPESDAASSGPPPAPTPPVKPSGES